MCITPFKLSPDGHVLAFVADGRLWIRSLDSLHAQPLAGTEGSKEIFWSPDSKLIAFFAEGKLKKIAASGGSAQIICGVSQAHGGTWNRDGIIVFPLSLTSGLFQVSAKVPLTAVRGSSPRLPEFLPDGRHFLYAAVSNPAEKGIYVGSLDGSPSVRLLPETGNAMYVPAAGASGQDGYLIFRRGQTLMAQRLNPKRLSLRGDASPLVEEIGGSSLWTAFSVSNNGTLVYATAGGARGRGANAQLVWWDRSGKQVGLFGPAGTYDDFRLAPNEKRVAFSMSRADNVDVWVLDAVRGISSRLTADPAIDAPPMWSPDGLRVVWRAQRESGDG